MQQLLVGTLSIRGDTRIAEGVMDCLSRQRGLRTATA